MIHSYLEKDLPTIQNKLGTMFEITTYYEKMPVDIFFSKFIKSDLCKEIDSNNLNNIIETDTNKLISNLLKIDEKNYIRNITITPEFWCGYVIAYMQWYFNISFSYIQSKIKPSEILSFYKMYHTFHIKHLMAFFSPKLSLPNKLKEYRQKKGYSQSKLARASGVPIRNIRAYEQGANEISKATGETLYYLSKALNCSIEELINQGIKK